MPLDEECATSLYSFAFGLLITKYIIFGYDNHLLIIIHRIDFSAASLHVYIRLSDSSRVGWSVGQLLGILNQVIVIRRLARSGTQAEKSSILGVRNYTKQPTIFHINAMKQKLYLKRPLLYTLQLNTLLKHADGRTDQLTGRRTHPLIVASPIF